MKDAPCNISKGPVVLHKGFNMSRVDCEATRTTQSVSERIPYVHSDGCQMRQASKDEDRSEASATEARQDVEQDRHPGDHKRCGGLTETSSSA